MNTDDPKSTHRPSNIGEATTRVGADQSDERFDDLFELASRGNITDPEATSLPAAERQLLDAIRGTLDALGSGWAPAPEEDVERLEARFLTLLAEEEPDHAWVRDEHSQGSSVAAAKGPAAGAHVVASEEPGAPAVPEAEVKTLGDLVRFHASDAPPQLSAEVMERLFENGTPLSDLLDVGRRPNTVGRAIQDAGAPQQTVMPVYHWVNQSIAGILPASNGVFVARRQKKSRGGSGGAR